MICSMRYDEGCMANHWNVVENLSCYVDLCIARRPLPCYVTRLVPEEDQRLQPPLVRLSPIASAVAAIRWWMIQARQSCETHQAPRP